MIKKSTKFRVVGEGDDAISNWHSPLAEYHSLTVALDYCEQANVEFPIKNLISTLINLGFNFKKARSYSITSSVDIYEVILHPYFKIENKKWGGDSPGRSGVYQTAYLQLGHTRELRKILKQTDKFLNEWLKSSVVIKENEDFKIKINASTKSTLPQITNKNTQQLWEDELFNQVEVAVKGNQKLTRLNYLVFQGVIFYLNRSWWHSLTGSVKNVTNRLRSAGFEVVDIEVVSTEIGSIPYFARRNEEEPNIGWNEKNLKINCPQEWSKKLESARKLSSA